MPQLPLVALEIGAGKKKILLYVLSEYEVAPKGMLRSRASIFNCAKDVLETARIIRVRAGLLRLIVLFCAKYSALQGFNMLNSSYFALHKRCKNIIFLVELEVCMAQFLHSTILWMSL